jgi:transcription elongation factor GreA-like protein/transcription elongation GreA/GreB family factor
MGYLEDFQLYIDNQDYSGFLKLWEEYCSNDEVDAQELKTILGTIKSSLFAEPFGKHVEMALLLWERIEEETTTSHDVIRFILDLEITNTSYLAEATYKYLYQHYKDHDHFNEKIRLIGLRNRDSFQGAISNYELLTHLNKGNFVFHSGGWGAGEILEVSLVREQLVVEFENVIGKKDLPFEKAFSYLVPLSNDNFLSQRFGDPDSLEEKAKKDPAGVIKLLLRDLGPQTALEIKDELCELVIPEGEWSKWWQSARSKIKKDTMVETPSSMKKPFRLRQTQLSHEERFEQAIKDKKDVTSFILTVYNFMRDFSETLKNETFKAFMKQTLLEKLSSEEDNLSIANRLQFFWLLQDLCQQEKNNYNTDDLMEEVPSFPQLINEIQIASHKKRLLTLVRKKKNDWPDIFLKILFSSQQAPIRDYILKELNTSETEATLKAELQQLLAYPTKFPGVFIWFFQKAITGKSEGLPFSDNDSKGKFLEAFLVLYHYLEQDQSHRDLVKKMYSILSAKRYLLIRENLEEKDLNYVKEFLLLVSKCNTLSDHDISILQSLAAVVHPSLSRREKSQSEMLNEQVIWTSQEGYRSLQEKINNLATVETVDNAKEIETARALGDLRENAEFKFALERRSRIQAELKMLSEQLQRARIITKDDIPENEVGVGCVVHLEIETSGKDIMYTFLGPWDANTDKNIISFQSKFAQETKGLKVGDSLEYQGEKYLVKGIESYLGAH